MAHGAMLKPENTKKKIFCKNSRGGKDEAELSPE